MASENLHPLEELKRLDQQVEAAQQLAELSPIFQRLDEIAKQHSADFEVQLVVGDVKQHVLNRGTKLKEQNQPLPEPPPLEKTAVIATPPPPPPVATAKPAEPPTVVMPSPLLASTPAPPPPAVNKLPEDLQPKRLVSSGQFAPPGQPAAPPPIPPSVPPPEPPPGPKPDAPTVVLKPDTPKPEAPRPETARPPALRPDAPTVVIRPEAKAGLPPNTGESPAVAPPKAAAPPPVPPTGGPSNAAQGPPVNRPPTGAPPPSGPNWKRALGIGAMIGLLLAVVGVGVVWYLAERNNNPMDAAVPVQIATNPTGASIRVNGEQICTSDCTAQLAPGTYQIVAMLDGYDPATSEITVESGGTGTLNLTLTPQPVSLRILADLAQGAVMLDGQPARALQDGQLMIERIEPGTHTVTVSGGTTEASFSFATAEARMPTVTGSITTRDLLAVIVTTFANTARVTTSSGPMKLAVNGQAQGDASPSGVDLADYEAGVAEIALGEGATQRTLQETFGSGPMLTAFFKSDANIGTLVVATGENDVRVFINDREYPRRTARGQLRVPIVGRVTVRVTKDGFEDPMPRTVNVAKGSETRVTFEMRPLPEFSTLDISGGTPGAEVAIDGTVVGTLSPTSGSLRNRSIEPGPHIIELRRAGFQPKRLERTFRRGQTVSLVGQDALLITEAKDTPAPPPAPPKSETSPPPKVTVAPKPRTGTMANFDAPEAWREEEGVWRHRGAAHLTYSMPPNGVFAFTIHRLRGGSIFRAGRVRWMIQYQDARNYSFYEMDDESFWSKVVQNGRTLERTKVKHGLDKDARSWPIQVDLSPQAAVIRAQRNGEWVVLDRWVEPGRDFTTGKFGILVNGNDEVGLTDFRFTGR